METTRVVYGFVTGCENCRSRGFRLVLHCLKTGTQFTSRAQGFRAVSTDAHEFNTILIQACRGRGRHAFLSGNHFIFSGIQHDLRLDS